MHTHMDQSRKASEDLAQISLQTQYTVAFVQVLEKSMAHLRHARLRQALHKLEWRWKIKTFK